MKLVLAVVFVFLTISSEVEGDVQCGNDKFCRIGYQPFKSKNRNDPDNVHLFRRQIAKKLAAFVSSDIIGIRKDYNEVKMLMNMYEDFCHDDTLGFLLDENVSDYQISCVWTGAAQFGQCRAVPPKYIDKPYNYIEGYEWIERVMKVHNALGCYLNTNNPVGIGNHTKNEIIESTTPPAFRSSTEALRIKNYELFICNERCVQGGIGYAASILILLTLAISFFKNCVDVAP